MTRLFALAVVAGLGLGSPAWAQFEAQDPVVYQDERGAFRALVHSWYHKYLNRHPDPASEDWALMLGMGTPPDMALSVFMSTPEYSQRSGGTPEGFVQHLFGDVVGRAPTQAEMNHWLGRLAAQEDRADVVYRFLKRHPPALAPAYAPAQVPFPQFGCHVRPEYEGLRIQTVAAGSAAAQLGLRQGDLIQAVDQFPVRTLRQLQGYLAGGGDHRLTVARNHHQVTASVRIGNRGVVIGQPIQVHDGIALPELGVHCHHEAGGVRIHSVQANSVAANLGLRAGDLIWGVEGRPVRNAQQLRQFLTSNAGDDRFRIDVRRNRERMHGYLGAGPGERITVKGKVRFVDDD
jgi:membrane-associated protease RseP (regulator of RpoE activity)